MKIKSEYIYDILHYLFLFTVLSGSWVAVMSWTGDNLPLTWVINLGVLMLTDRLLREILLSKK